MLLKGLKELADALELTVMEADFVAEEKGTDKLFSSQGYQIFDGTEVSYISLDDAIDSANVKKFIDKASEENLHVVSFESLSPSRQRGMLAVLDEDAASYDLEGLSLDLSAFALGQYNQPVGCILVREHDSDIIIDSLQVNDDKDEYAAALFGHLYNILKIEKGTGIRIGFIANNDNVMDRIGEVIGYVMDIEAGMSLSHAVKLM